MISMTIWQAIISGIVQGVTEFLPVSSSGHLLIVRELFGVHVDSLSFDVAVHVATLVAVVWVMRDDIVQIIREFFSKKWWHSIAFKIVVATIPAVVFGLMLNGDLLAVLRTTQVVAVSLIFWGVILFAADVYVRKQTKLVKKLENMRWMQVVIIGLAQAVALIPGTSRSGITMTAGMLSGVNREQAARFSFLLSIPAILGAAILALVDASQTGLDIDIWELIAGCVAALISGMVAVRFLLSFLKKGTFVGFAIYRILLGLFLLFVLF